MNLSFADTLYFKKENTLEIILGLHRSYKSLQREIQICCELNNLTFNGNIGLYLMQSPLQNQNPLMEQLSMAYDASITYQPFKNSILQFRIQKIPHQKSYSPFYKRFNQ